VASYWELSATLAKKAVDSALTAIVPVAEVMCGAARNQP